MALARWKGELALVAVRAEDEQVGEAGRAKKRSRPARSEADKPDAGQKRGGTQERSDDEQYSLEQYGSREYKIGQYSQEAVDEATKPRGSWDEMLGRLQEWQVGCCRAGAEQAGGAAADRQW